MHVSSLLLHAQGTCTTCAFHAPPISPNDAISAMSLTLAFHSGNRISQYYCYEALVDNQTEDGADCAAVRKPTHQRALTPRLALHSKIPLCVSQAFVSHYHRRIFEIASLVSCGKSIQARSLAWRVACEGLNVHFALPNTASEGACASA